MPLKPLVTALLATALAGCAGLGAPARPALPPPADLACCWQSQERVRISARGEEHTLLAAVAVTPGKLTVVAFDDLGRRLVTLTHEGGEPRTLEAPPGWPDELSRQLLLAVYLHNLAPDQWRFDDPRWSVDDMGETRSLRYRGRDLVRLRYATADGAGDGARDIDYPGRDIRLRILTLSRAEL